MVHLIDFLNCQLLFFCFILFLGLLFLVAGLLLILTESSVHSILYLMFLFLFLTELTILLKMEFIALIFIIVYIGAVCVLMLFHIKLIKTFLHRYDNVNHKELFLPYLIISIIIPFFQILTLFFEEKTGEMSQQINFLDHFILRSEKVSSFNYSNWVDFYETLNSTQVLGVLIYNVYFICLLIGSLILFVAMIGSIFLTLVKKKDKNFQKIDQQIFLDFPDLLVFR